MSFRFIEGVRVLPSSVKESLNSSDGIVLYVLAHHSNNDGYSFPSFATLAEECFVDRRTIRRVVKRLRQSGIISISKGPMRCPLFKLEIPPLDHPQKISTGGPKIGGTVQMMGTICPHKADNLSSLVVLKADNLSSKGDRLSPKLTGTDRELKGEGNPPSSLRLSGAERISLEREDKALEAEFRSLQSDFMSDADRLRRREIKERRQKIKERLFIPL